MEFPRDINDTGTSLREATPHYAGNIHILNVMQDRQLGLESIPRVYHSQLQEFVRREGSVERVGEHGRVLVYTASDGRTFLTLGTGKQEAWGRTERSWPFMVEKARQLVGTAYKAAVKLGREGVLSFIPPGMGEGNVRSDHDLVAAAAEAAELAGYAGARMWDATGTSDPKITGVHILVQNSGRFERTYDRAHTLAEAENLVRRLFEGDSQYASPDRLYEVVQKLVSKHDGLELRQAVSRKDLVNAPNGHPFYALGRVASASPEAWLLELRYKGNPGKRNRVDLIGKGITFDTGGENHKPTGSIENMPGDMGGAATVIGTLLGHAQLRSRINERAFLVLTENNVGSGAYKPGEILSLGRDAHGNPFPSFTIGNTDAEGRVVMATAAALISQDPSTKRYTKAVIDLSTLTGATMIALGGRFSGGLYVDMTDARAAAYAAALTESGAAAGEFFQIIQVLPGFEERIKNKTIKEALVNVGGPDKWGSAQDGRSFLQAFLPQGVPFIHGDIATVLDNPKGHRSYAATMFNILPVRAMVGGLERIAEQIY